MNGRIFAAVLFLCVVLFHQSSWAEVKYYPTTGVCDIDMACMVNGIPQKVALGDLTEEECNYVFKKYGEDRERFCIDLLIDKISSSDEDEGDENTNSIASR